VAKFRQALTDHVDQFAKIAEEGRASGAIHHRFAVGDGFVFAVDEWESVEHFQKFFTNPDLMALVAMAGASPQQPLEITLAQAIPTSDQF
jgi:quinol monooxygenase YgiN